MKTVHYLRQFKRIREGILHFENLVSNTLCRLLTIKDNYHVAPLDFHISLAKKKKYSFCLNFLITIS